MSPLLRQVVLSTLACTVACYRSDSEAQGVPQQRVQHAKDQAEAAKSLKAWDAHLSKAKKLAERADHRGAMAEVEQAMRLVERFGIRDEGATYNEAYTLLEGIAPPQKNALLLQLLADANLIEAKGAIVSQAVAHLELDSKAREQLMAMPQDKQVETLRDLLTR
jgi:hypothetical protein